MGSDIFLDQALKEDEKEDVLPMYSENGGHGDDGNQEIMIKPPDDFVKKRKKLVGDMTEEYGSSENLRSKFGSETDAHLEAIRKGKNFSKRDQNSFVNTSLYRGCSDSYSHERDSEILGERRRMEKNEESLPYYVVPTRTSSGDYVIHFFNKDEFSSKPSLGDISFSLKKSLKSLFGNMDEAIKWAERFNVDFTGSDKENLLSNREAFDEFAKKLEFKKLMHELKDKLEERKDPVDSTRNHLPPGPIFEPEKEKTYEVKEQIWFTSFPSHIDRTSNQVKFDETTIDINSIRNTNFDSQLRNEVVLNIPKRRLPRNEDEIVLNIPTKMITEKFK